MPWPMLWRNLGSSQRIIVRRRQPIGRGILCDLHWVTEPRGVESQGCEKPEEIHITVRLSESIIILTLYNSIYIYILHSYNYILYYILKISYNYIAWRNRKDRQCQQKQNVVICCHARSPAGGSYGCPTNPLFLHADVRLTRRGVRLLSRVTRPGKHTKSYWTWPIYSGFTH